MRNLIFPALALAALLVVNSAAPGAVDAAQQSCNNKVCQDDDGGDWQNCVQTTNGPTVSCTGGGEGKPACESGPCTP